MTLENFLNVLEPNIKLSVVEGESNDELIRLFSGGQDQLSDEILAKEIDSIIILGKSFLQIHLASV